MRSFLFNDGCAFLRSLVGGGTGAEALYADWVKFAGVRSPVVAVVVMPARCSYMGSGGDDQRSVARGTRRAQEPVLPDLRGGVRALTFLAVLATIIAPAVIRGVS